jgi:nucleotide-binding universal stress UspA family protein
MYQRILVAIDGSQTSRRAFAAALELAKSYHSVLQAYYAIEDPGLYYDVPSYDPSILRAQLAEAGATLAQDFTKQIHDAGVDGAVVVGEPSALDDIATRVLRAAAEFQADLLVMGTHGRRGVKRLVLGSVAERCLRQSALPVLLIPSAAVPAGAAE